MAKGNFEKVENDFVKKDSTDGILIIVEFCCQGKEIKKASNIWRLFYSENSRQNEKFFRAGITDNYKLLHRHFYT
ncbi:MAG: hypothetical protein NTX03_11180, partial [Bacteroidetes bacterium]|nr:hypothetical protein [Bacteroidota bacterium]